jgi:hypothetical protein
MCVHVHARGPEDSNLEQILQYKVLIRSLLRGVPYHLRRSHWHRLRDRSFCANAGDGWCILVLEVSSLARPNAQLSIMNILVFL